MFVSKGICSLSRLDQKITSSSEEPDPVRSPHTRSNQTWLILYLSKRCQCVRLRTRWAEKAILLAKSADRTAVVWALPLGSTQRTDVSTFRRMLKGVFFPTSNPSFRTEWSLVSFCSAKATANHHNFLLRKEVVGGSRRT